MFHRPPTEMTSQEMIDEALLLSEQRAQPFYTDERRAQISKRMNSLFFELNCQQQEEIQNGATA